MCNISKVCYEDSVLKWNICLYKGLHTSFTLDWNE